MEVFISTGTIADGLLKQELSPWKKLVGQIVFGGSDFVADIQSRLSDANEIGEIPRAQRFPGRPTLGELFLKQLRQNYPADRYEVILVENGSDERTLSIARRLAACSGMPKVSVLQGRKGVSRAKILRLAHASPESEWVVFCDKFVSLRFCTSKKRD